MANFSFDAFVGETELGRGYVSELERGLVVPTVAVLDRIAAALGLTIADLVLGDTSRERLFKAIGDLRGGGRAPAVGGSLATEARARRARLT